jgi:hypothetical protein
MKKLMFLLMMICLSANSWAQTSGNCGKANATDVTWSYNTDTKTLTISGTGDMADFTSGAAPWNAYLSSITSVVIESGVTSIGNYAFKNCSVLTSVSIPSGVTSIGVQAFSGCSGLTSVIIPGSVTSIGDFVFYGCSGLTSVSIPSGVTSIGFQAFKGCSGLTSVSIPTSVISIGTRVFEGCSGLTTITVDASNATYRSTDGGNNECNAILSKDGKTLFAGCKTTTIPGGVTSIGNYVFYGCSGLTSVSIPSGVTSIGDYVFYGCSGLTSVSIPESVTSIGEYAFYHCSALTSVSIPGGVTSIGTYAFRGCTGLTSVSIPSGVTSIGDRTFADCSGLTSVSIPSGVTSIGNNAFQGCSGLTSVSIPSGVTSIGNLTFFNCSALTSVSIPGSVTSIGSSAFLGCSGLTSVYYNTTSPITYDSNWKLGSTASPARTLHIPAEATAAFTANGWTTDVFSSISADIPAGTCGTGVSWVLVDHTLTISGAGAMADYGSESAPWSSYSSRITSVVIESGVTSIGKYAFKGYSVLSSVSIPSGVTSIGFQAFFNCPALTSVSIPTSVISIGTRVFEGCSGLTTITVDVSNATYRSTDGDNNECNAILSKDGKTLIAGCKTTTIPSGVTSIGDRAFQSCSTLTSVSIPSSVTSIGNNAFYACSGLTLVNIPNSVTSIGNDAFYGCTALTDVYYNTTSPIDYNAYWKLGSTDRTLHIPAGAKDAFSGWTQYFAAVKDDIVDVTAATGLVYTGSEQTGVQAATGYYTVTDGTKTDAGNYTATASLADGYVWPDGTTAPKTIAWSIAQATNAWTTEPSMADYAYGATPSTTGTIAATFGTPQIGYFTDEACTNAVDLTTGKPAPGTYYMEAAVAGTGNYTALSSVVAFHIMNQIVTLNEKGTDNGLSGKDAVMSDVTYARAFTAAKWSTICLPFALTSAQMGTAFGGSCKVAKLEGVSSGVLSFTSVTDMAAGTPYIIKFSGTAPTALTFNDVTIDKTDGSFTVGAGETCTMTGTSAVTDIPNNANHYIMQGNKIYRVVTDDVKMAAFRAYLTYSESAGAPAKASALTFDVDGETTGIAGVGVDSSNVNDAWYTLGGQKLSKKPTANGIYISNGRKIIIK